MIIYNSDIRMRMYQSVEDQMFYLDQKLVAKDVKRNVYMEIMHKLQNALIFQTTFEEEIKIFQTIFEEEIKRNNE